jgi:hypothetical protein
MMGGFGLLYMARGLAWRRAHCAPLRTEQWVPVERHLVTFGHYAAHEYYAILDRIGRGEKP